MATRQSPTRRRSSAAQSRNDDRKPCDRVLTVLGPQNDIVTHRQALPHKDVAAATETVRAGSAQPAVRLAFEFLVLTAARTLGDGNRLVFPMRSGRPIATSTLPEMLQQHEIAAVPHGLSLRRSMSIAMAHSSTDRMALAGARPWLSRP